MPDISTILAFIAAAMIAAIVPGPTVSVVVASALSRGARAGLSAVLGGQVALLLMTLLIAVGLEAVLSFMSWAFDIIKIVGAAYLVWLGWKMFNSRGGLQVGASGKPRGMGDYALQGFLVVAANPKTLLFFGSFLPQFIDPSRPVFPQVITFGLLAMAVGIVSDGGYAVLAGRARHLISEARLRVVNKVSGALLMVGGVWLALQRRV